jgi:hypothetical protein
MTDLLFKLLPMILSMTVSQIIYSKCNMKYNITNKISLILHIKRDWLAFAFICIWAIIMLLVGVIGIYWIDISSTLYFIISGILVGITLGIRYAK